jgi:hypothetical protein
MLRLVLGLLFALGIALPAEGQGTIIQSGPITQFHILSWLQNGVVVDGGAINQPQTGLISMFGGASCPFGIASSTGPGTLSGQYAQLTICQTTANTIFDINSYGGLPSPGIEFIVNGVVYPFPGSGGSSATGYTVASGNVDTVSPSAITGDTLTVLWNSASATAKTENLPVCNGALAWKTVRVVDQIGTASATYPIITVPNGADSIRGLPSWPLNFGYDVTDFQCNGSGFWVAK